MVSFFRLFCVVLILAGCSSSPMRTAHRPASELGNQVAIFSLNLMDTGYRFGGKNPEAGLDCSGMVSYVFREAARVKVSGSASDIARSGDKISLAEAAPGDLVFFSTRGMAYGHVAIYLGENRFIHAPNKKSVVRTDRIEGYWRSNFREVRRYF